MGKLIFVSSLMALTSVALITLTKNNPDTNVEHSGNPLKIFQKESLPHSQPTKVESKPREDGLRWVKKSKTSRPQRDVKTAELLPENHDAAWQESIRFAMSMEAAVLSVESETQDEMKEAEQAKKDERGSWPGEMAKTHSPLNIARVHSPTDRRCIHVHCVELLDPINVVGLVVETERLQKKSEGIMAGEVELGDARKLPALYMK